MALIAATKKTKNLLEVAKCRPYTKELLAHPVETPLRVYRMQKAFPCCAKKVEGISKSCTADPHEL